MAFDRPTFCGGRWGPIRSGLQALYSSAMRLSLFFVGLLLVGGGWAQEPFELEVLRADLPSAMVPGEGRLVAVTFVNRGARSWEPGAGFSVAAHWFFPDGEEMVWDGPRTELPTTVPSGKSVNIDVLVSAPAEEGPALIQFDVVQEDVLWVSRRSKNPATFFPVVITRMHSFVLDETEMPAWARAGSQVRTRVSLRNDGLTAWESDGTFGVAAHWRRPHGGDVIWEGRRTRMPHRIGTGETVMVSAAVDVPEGAGSWLLEWDVVHEGVCWFSERIEERPRSEVVVVLPSCAEGWPAVGATLVLIVLALGLVRGWWGTVDQGRYLDLIWVVVTPWLVERTVTEIGVRGGLVSLLGLVALAAVMNLFPRGYRLLLAWLGGASVVVLLVADRVYVRFFQDLPSVGSIGGVGQADRLGASVLSLVEPGDVVLLCAAALGFLVIFLVHQIPAVPVVFEKRLVIAGVVLAFFGLILGSAARGPAVRQVFRRLFVARDIGVIGAHIVDVGGWAGRSLARRGLTPVELARVERWYRDHAPGRVAAGPLFGVARDLNLLMIQAESLQLFVPGLSIEGQEVTPTLNRWAREGIVFDRVTDQTGHGRSSDAELLTQVSLLPLADGVAAFAGAGNSYTSLAGVLTGIGYSTLSAVPFDRTFWNRSVTHQAYGYSQSLFAGDFAPGEMVGWGLSDREFLGRMGRRLADLPEPFCAWLITLSLHHPFAGFPEGLKELDVGRWTGSPVGAYLHTMRYFDRALADLEEGLVESDLFDSTVIVVWGDHDAGFEWTPEVAALMGVTPDEAGWYVSQRVPLVIHLPTGLGISGHHSDPAGHVDVAPTLAALLGIDPAPMAWMGRNLLGQPGDEPVVGEYDCWMDSRHVFLQGDGSLEGGECLDVDTLNSRPVSACAAAFQRAGERVEIAQLVLQYDLQEKLTTELLVDSP